MTRLVHLGLLLMALLGLIGQSTAMAMMPAGLTAISANRSVDVSMKDMDCMDMANSSPPGQSPCKKMTLQCMAAMGCASAAMVESEASGSPLLVVDRTKAALTLAARLWGRTYGPELDPPSFLI
ncbi:MAG: hypothetical protein ABIR87_03785 [Sphingomicrobium sp.]